jgi:3-oxoacyl-[acyl-carrier protein] reductase
MRLDRNRVWGEAEISRNQNTALVGGGATGIGYAIAAALAPTCRVTITGRTAESLDAAARRLKEQTGAAVTTATYDIAGSRLPDIADGVDVLIVNAGGPPPGRILDVDEHSWYAGAELLLHGPLRLARAALPGMAARGFGRVVFVTSTVVRQPQPDLAISVVLRAAATAAAKLLSREYANFGVTVNCVAPGPTDTARRGEILAARAALSGESPASVAAADAAQVPAGRAGAPEEIAAAVAFLVSAQASYVNGIVLTVDGGRTETI